MKSKNTFLTKFAAVAIAIGFFSPTVNVTTEKKTTNEYAMKSTQIHVTLFNTAEARRVEGRHNKGHKKANRNVNRNSNKNINVNRNVNKNVNVNVNHNNRYYGGRHYGYYRGRPLVGFTTGLVIGTMISAATMPSTCTTVITNGISYRRCGSSYYQPFYEGDTLVYQVVASPY